MKPEAPLDPEAALACAEDLVRLAQTLGAAGVEVFYKAGRSRALVLEPDLSMAGKPRVTTSHVVEEGVGLRVLDRRGRWGFAWRSPAPDPGNGRAGKAVARSLVLEGLASARGSTDRLRGRPGRTSAVKPPEEELAPPPAGREAGIDLALDDPGMMASPVEDRLSRLAEACEAAQGVTGGAAFVDKARWSEAKLTIALANSRGFRGSYRKSLALLSISVAPAAAGARSVLEERAACRIATLDPRECGVEAALRALPPRSPLPPPEPSLPVVFAARATAALLAALAPLTVAPPEGTTSGEDPGEPPVNLRRGLWVTDQAAWPGAVGSAPFDGAGFETRETIILAAGRPTGLLLSEKGHRIRPSYREPPETGLTNLRLIPPSGAGPLMPGGRSLRIASARFLPGPRWTVQVWRGDWYSGDEPAGPADGLTWTGPLEAILTGVAAVGAEARLFHLGLPVGAAAIVVEGLRGWVIGQRGSLAIPAPGHPPDQRVSGGRIRSKIE